MRGLWTVYVELVAEVEREETDIEEIAVLVQELGQLIRTLSNQLERPEDEEAKGE